MGKFRKFCATIKIKEDTRSIKNFVEMVAPNMRYLIVAKELSKTGYLHYQIYGQIEGEASLKKLKEYLGRNDAHIEAQRGTNEEARTYCWKGYFEEKGTKFPQPSAIFIEIGRFCEGSGDRTDLTKIKERIDLGDEIYTIVQEEEAFNAFARYHAWFYKYKAESEDQKYSGVLRPKCENWCLYGEAGTGKSEAILRKYGKNAYVLDNPQGDNKNWNGYKGQEILIIDDFYGWLRYSDLLKILDNKPYKCRKLGSYTWARWKKVYVTSNKPIKKWFPSMDNIDALYSRFEKCLKVTRGNTGALVRQLIRLPCRNRHNHSEYLDLDNLPEAEPELDNCSLSSSSVAEDDGSEPLRSIGDEKNGSASPARQAGRPFLFTPKIVPKSSISINNRPSLGGFYEVKKEECECCDDND